MANVAEAGEAGDGIRKSWEEIHRLDHSRTGWPW